MIERLKARAIRALRGLGKAPADPGEVLRSYVEQRLMEYPHGTPHPVTVEAIAQGVEALIAVSNARPAKYANEPWISQGVACHLTHAQGHLERTKGDPWARTDLDQPEAAHAALRLVFALFDAQWSCGMRTYRCRCVAKPTAAAEGGGNG